MLNNFFLIYANNSFIDDSDNLYKILDEIKSSLSIKNEGFIDDSFGFIFDNIIAFAKDNDPEIADQRRATIINQWINSSKKNEHYKENNITYTIIQKALQKMPKSKYLDIAYEAVYKYRNGYCEDKDFGCCLINNINLDELLQKHNLKPNTRLMCFECHQLLFVDLMHALSQGQYSDLISSHFIHQKKIIPRSSIKEMTSYKGHSLFSLLKNSYTCVGLDLEISKNGNLKQTHFLNFTGLFQCDDFNRGDSFNDFMTQLIGYSLTEFIIKNDLRKLKYWENK